MSSKTSDQIEKHILDRFNILKKVGSGAYGHVWKVQQKETKKIFALKKIFDAFQHSTDAQRTYRQIQILRQIDHPNVVKLFDTIPAENNRDVYLLFQYMESDLHNAIGDNILKDAHFRFITYQIAKALKYLHSGLIIHRDLKPSNILINSDCKIKLCDFGLVRSLLNANQNNPVLTQGVATRWYRAPEVLLGSKCYSTPADIWSFGCIIYESIQRKPLFPGNSTIDQLQKILSFVGFPSQLDIDSLQSQVSRSMIKQIKQNTFDSSASIFKGISPLFHDLISKMIVFNPKKRITIQEILKHPVIKSFRKQEEEIVSHKKITTSIDDNQKLTVDEYRHLIYYQKNVIKRTTSGMLPITNYNKNQKQLKNVQNINDNFKPSIKKSLNKIRSWNNIKDIQNIQKTTETDQNQIRNSWKHVINSPQEALRLSGKFLVKTSKDFSQNQEQRTQIEKSDIPNINQINPVYKQTKGQTFFNPMINSSQKTTFGTFLWNSPNKLKGNLQKHSNNSPKNYFMKKIN